jgi:phosphoribosylformimino-5-aminoimidazole carboxamide ribotide isomerase
MSGFTLYPAIDVRAGHVVRLRQGDYAKETRYSDDPSAVAQRYAQAGASWLHLVDLDAAPSGGYTLMPLLAGIKAATLLHVQTGGGVRSVADVAAILDAGADRVVVGSLAIRDPELVMGWLQRFGSERIIVALDVRQADDRWLLPTAGWTQQNDATLDELLRRHAGAGLRHLLCTDISRDGMLAGPNLALYRDALRRAPDVQLQASGGVRDIADIVAARDAGCGGAVLGKALLENRFDLVEALREERPC